MVGSGIMAERLAGGNAAIALLGNTIPTGAILIVIITIFGPVSGAHFNPAVSLVFASAAICAGARSRPISLCNAPAALRTIVAHLMFDLAPLAIGIKGREGRATLAGAVATFTLIVVILGGLRDAAAAVPWLVGLPSPRPIGSRRRPRSPIRR